MAKPAKSPVELPKTVTPERLSWPNKPNELPDYPRLWRVHRLNKFEWQAYCVGEHGEQMVGKPDLYDIVIRKIDACMKHEGQREFLERVKAQALKEQAVHRAH